MNAAQRIMVKMIRGYQLILSPWVGRSCRFVPTCSAYSIEAIQRYGALKGAYLTFMRIARCHPLGGSGYDPVPSKFLWRCWRHEDQIKR